MTTKEASKDTKPKKRSRKSAPKTDKADFGKIQMYEIYYTADLTPIPREQADKTRLVHRMECPKKPGAFHQLSMGMHLHMKDALAEARELKPRMEFKPCPHCLEREAGRVGQGDEHCNL